MKRSNIYLERLTTVAAALKQLNDQVVFVGGAIVPLLITDEASPDVRPTIDVDVVVEVVSQIKFYSFESELRKLGFIQDLSDSEESICRYKLADILIDFMPLSENFLGFSNIWYKLAVKTASDPR